MCFGTPDMPETPVMPDPQGADEAKSGVNRQAKKRKGYQSTILAGDLQAPAPVEKKRLLGE